MRNPRAIPNWLPKTPMAQDVDTCVAGNQAAASSAGIPNMNICETATIVWPQKTTGKHQLACPVPNTLTQLPIQVPNDPMITDFRRPCFCRNQEAGKIKGMYVTI